MYNNTIYAAVILLTIHNLYSAEFKKESAEMGIAMHIENFFSESIASDEVFKTRIADCIKDGADINNPTYIAVRSRSITPLERVFFVSSYNSKKRNNRINILINLGANVNTINKSKGMHTTALHHAIKNARFNTAIRLITNHNARCDVKNDLNQTALRLLCATPIDWEKLPIQKSQKALDLLSLLLEKTPVICASLPDEPTLIEEAITQTNLPMIPLLKEHGIK